MNRFWGRNEDGSAPKFSRDDEQLLALNYENLCDADYLNRLFISDENNNDSGIISDISQNMSQNMGNLSDSSLYCSDIAEDLVLFGNAPDLAHLFFEKRFYKDIVNFSLKSQDSISSLVSRQSIVFEHIGKLMIERCFKKAIDNTIVNTNISVEKQVSKDSSKEESSHHLVSNALFCALDVLSKQFNSNLFINDNNKLIDNSRLVFKSSSIEPIISIVLQICDDFNNNCTILKNKYARSTRNILMTAFTSSFINSNITDINSNEIEELLRLQLSCLYSILLIGLRTKNSSDVIMSTSYLMALLMKVEEWQESFYNENTLLPPHANLTELCISHSNNNAQKTTSGGTNNNVNTNNNKTNLNSKLANPSQKLSNNHTNSKILTKPGSVQHNGGVVKSASQAIPAVSNNSNSNNNNVKSSTIVVKSTEENRVEQESTPILIANNNNQQGNTHSKPWDKKLEKNKLVKKYGDIDPSLINNSVVVNHVSVNLSNAPHKVSHKSNNNNNNEITDNVTKSKPSTSKNVSTTNQSFKPNKDPKEKVRNEIREFNEMIQNSLKVPKTVLRIIHDSCSRISNDLNNLTTSATSSVPSKTSGESKSTNKFSTYVWSCGQNSYGELGLGDVNLRKTFAKVTSLDSKCIISIGAGNEHSLFVTRDGKLYSSGYNDNGQCGMGSTQQVRHPTIIQTLDGEEISQVNVYNGCEHTVALTRDGKMFSFGYNYRGQLGLGSTNSESVPRPVRGLLSRKVILAACSYHHTLILCSDGSLFSCGRNDCGQLGHGDTIDKKTPQAVINCPRNINSISCGQFHTVAAANSGVVYVCGKNDYGQLGLESLSNVKVFTKTLNNPEIDNIIQVCCGYYHTLILASNGVIAGFGRNDYGQLGLGHSQQKVYVSTIISTLRDKGVTMISAGCYHSIAVTSNGMLYVFGRNNHGQLATGDLEERHLPHPVDDFIGQTIISVAAGFYHTLILAVNNNSTDSDILSKDTLYKSNLLVGPDAAGDNMYSYSPFDQYLESTASTGSNLAGDTVQFTGIQSSLPKAKNYRIPVSLESKSKVSNRQLLIFMMNQIDTFFSCDSQNNISVNFEKNDEVININSLISSITMMISISKQSFDEAHVNYKLPISFDDGLNFMHKLIKIISSLLKKYKPLLLEVIGALKKSTENELLNQFDLSCFSHAIISSVNDNIKHSVDLCNIFNKGLVNFDNLPELINVVLFNNIIAMRNVLLNCYFSMRVDEDKKIKLNEFLVDLSIMFTKYYEIFLPTPQLCALFFLTVKDNITNHLLNDNFRNNNSTITDINRTHHSLNIRLLTIYCSIYKNNDEVVTLFQNSKIYGLAIFRYMLSLYNSFSRLIIEKKAQINSMGSSNSLNSDIRRIISVLEYSIANFIKCAMPIIFTSAQFKGSDTELYNTSIEIIKEVLTDAEAIIDYLLFQPLLTDDILNQLKYGTIMPSILPSIFLYGIAFTKYGFNMLELINPVRSFIAKIQFIGKPVDVKLSNSEKKIPKEEDHTVDGPSEGESLVSKKDNNSTWWYRLLKLASTYMSKMATTLIYFPKKKAKDFYARIEFSAENNESNSINTLDFSNHPLWNYLYYNSAFDNTNRQQLGFNLRQNIQDNSVLDSIVDICKAFREREKNLDPMYKMLTQSNNILFSNNVFHEIEDTLMEIFIHFYGSISEKNVVGLHYFKLISRFIKYIHSKRSIVVSNSNGLSWMEILLIIHNVIKYFANFLLQCELKIYQRPLLIGFNQNNKSKTFQVFRRVVMVIVCLSRWRNNINIKVKSIGSTIINFIYVATNAVTENISTVDIDVVSGKIEAINCSFLKSCEYVENYIRGTDILTVLLDDSSNLSLKCDVLANLISSLRDKHLYENQTIDSLKKLGEQSIIDIDGDIYVDTHCCNKDLFSSFKTADKLIVSQLIKIISNYCNVSYLFTQNDLNLISYGIKLLQLFNNRNSIYILLEGFPNIPLFILQKLLSILNDKQKISNNLDEKTNKKILNIRERNIAYNRTIGAIVTYIQYLSIQSKGSSTISPNDSLQLCQVYSTLIRDYQLQRLEAIQESNNAEDSTARFTNDSASNKSGNIVKENNKKRCQDLISKPMEFNRVTEGFVVQGEKLINNNKGNDFSMAFWIMMAKQLPTKSSFILGKVNHNDVWPIIVTRGDGKLEIHYGNNNEFEKVVTEFSMSLYIWSHVAIVIEQKKIKVFINGVLDCQSTITKTNTRAISFPLIVGTCPSNVRTRVNLIKEGFDGLLAQLKYYSRALSPIHIRVIYDSGPPESSDVSEKLIYKLLCAMKSTISFVDNAYAKSIFQESANILHFLFVSDSSRRNRFAALDVLKDILLSDSIRDIQLCANSGVDKNDNSLSIFNFDNINYELESFHEHMIVYLIRLIGLSFAPHLYSSSVSSEENNNNNNDSNNNLKEYISINSSALSGFTKYTPNFIYFESNNGTTLAPTNGDCNNTSLRKELCNQVVRLIIELSEKSSQWNDVVSTILHKILQKFSSPHENELIEIDTVLKIDSIGIALLLGGGTSGQYLGSTINNYFADSKSIILNVNTTTNYVTLLGQNMLRTQKQITKVRLTDIIINEDNDKLLISNFSGSKLLQQLIPEMFAVMNKLSQFLPLLISDLFSILRPDHMYQYSVLLKSLRPLESFLYSQLLKSLSFYLESNTVSGVESVLKNAKFYDTVKQAAISTASSVVFNKSSSASDISDVEEKSEDKTISSLWFKSSKYLISMPKKLVFQSVIAEENETIFCDYIAQYFGLAIESILSTPYELLLRKGRMSELLFCLSTLETKPFYKYIHDDIRKNYNIHSYLTSDWSNTDTHLLEYDTSNALLFLHSMRSSIINCSKSILCHSYKSILEMTDKSDLSDDLFLWESILMKGNEMSENLWKFMSKYYIRTYRIEITQSMACRLKFAALSLLQLSVMRSNDNILERTDIFGRIIGNLYNWLELNNGTIGHEDLCFHILKTLLPALSFIECTSIELQLMQLCCYVLKMIIISVFNGYSLSKEILDLAKSNNFTLLRARAQEQTVKYKGHSMATISSLTYNLTQLMSYLEIVQRLGCIPLMENEADIIQTYMTPRTSPRNTPNSVKLAQLSIQTCDTATPKLLSIRSASIDADLSTSAASVLILHQKLNGTSSYINTFNEVNILIEVAIGVGVHGGDVYFETVYCGSSLRFVQSGLVPECSYVMKCRGYYGSNPLNWSDLVEFRTDKGLLFHFDSMKCGPDILLNENLLVASYSGDDTWSTLLGSKSFSSGVTSWDVRINQSSTAYVFIGIATSSSDLYTFLGGDINGWGFIGEQALYHNREKVKIYGESFSSGDIIGVSLDLHQGTLCFSKNGKNLGVAFDKIYGEFYPAVAFYNVGQELEILADSFKTSCPHETIPISLNKINTDDISLLNEFTLSLYYKKNLSQRLVEMVTEHCNHWCASMYSRHHTISGREIYVMKEAVQLKKYGLQTGDRVRTIYGVAEVAGFAYNKVWFRMNATGDIWFVSNQQIMDGKAKKLFTRCTYDTINNEPTPSSFTTPVKGSNVNSYESSSISDLIDMSKWSDEMDNVLVNFLTKTSEVAGVSNPYSVSSDDVCDNFRGLQQQLSRLVMTNNDLSHKWGIAGPKRKAVLARIGLLRLLNQFLDTYLPFLVTDTSNTPFLPDKGIKGDDFAPLVVSLAPTSKVDIRIEDNKSVRVIKFTEILSLNNISPYILDSNQSLNKWPVISKSIENIVTTNSEFNPKEILIGPLHTMRNRIFTNIKMTHFWEVVKKSQTRPMKTDDDYDYPDDLAHVKINRLKSFRAKEAAELMHISGEDLILSSMFCQLWKELRQYSSEKLRISYTHPMDDGQSRTFKIKFEGEGVDDYGGPYREIFQQVTEELQMPDPSESKDKRPSVWDNSNSISVNDNKSSLKPAKCFLPLLLPTPNWTTSIDCKERYRFTLNPATQSLVYVDLFKFFGQFVGIAIRSKITLDFALTSYIYKCVVQEKLTEQDIASFDAPAYEFISRLQFLLNQLHHYQSQPFDNTVTDVINNLKEEINNLICDLNWTATQCDGSVVELVEYGNNKPLHIDDVQLYLDLYINCRLTESKVAIDSFRSGLISIIPEVSLSLLNWSELEHIICGVHVIDVVRLKENTEYDDDLSPDDDHIISFWEILSNDFSEEEKSAFLRFVWARPSLPPAGTEFSQKLRILSAVGDEAQLKPDQYLPKAHTCFFSINLPKYSTKEIMREKLRYAIFNCTEMDADFRTTESEVAGWGAAANNEWLSQVDTYH